MLKCESQGLSVHIIGLQIGVQRESSSDIEQLSVIKDLLSARECVSVTF